jgi:hypothetical protein
MDKTFKELKKYIEKYYGERCEDTDVLCPVCQVWYHYDYLEKTFEYISVIGYKGKKISKG